MPRPTISIPSSCTRSAAPSTTTIWSAHVTSRGELIIMNKAGVLATKRKRKWKVYDAADFENSLAKCLGHRDVAANLLEVVFDLSFRRQGALLVYDAEHCILAAHLESRKHRVARLEPQRPHGARPRMWAGVDPSIDRRHRRRPGRRLAQEKAAIDRNGQHRRRGGLRRRHISWRSAP